MDCMGAIKMRNKFLIISIIVVALALIATAEFFVLTSHAIKEPEVPVIVDYSNDSILPIINLTPKEESITNASEQIINSTENASVSRGGGGGSSSNVPEQEQTPIEKYAEIYGLTLDTIIFYYSDDVHSLNMLSIVEDLESNYTFYKTDDLWDKNAQEYLEMVGTTPTFICVKNNEKLVGEISKEQLIDFAENC